MLDVNKLLLISLMVPDVEMTLTLLMFEPSSELIFSIKQHLDNSTVKRTTFPAALLYDWLAVALFHGAL